MTLLHAHAHYICIVCTKYQKASVKALVQVEFLMYALSTCKYKHIIKPYLIGSRKKPARFTKLSFCQKFILWHQTSSHKCSMCLYCRATENQFFVGSDQFLVCKTNSICIKCIFFGPKKHTLLIIYWPNYLD